MRKQARVLGILWASVIGLSVSAQTIVNIDYGAYFADFDSGSTEPNIAQGLWIGGTWGERQQSLATAGAALTLDSAVKFSGLRSQRISISRASGSSGALHIHFDPIPLNRRYFVPPEGQPLLVRIAYRAEGFVNARYGFRFCSGDRWGDLLPATDSTTNGWNILSQVVPLERSNQGGVRLLLRLEITLGEGAAQGTIWIDSLQVLAHPITVPARARPNPIKVAHYNVLPEDLAEFTTVPVQAVVGGRQVLALRQLAPHVETGVYFTPFTSFDHPTFHYIDLYDYYDCDVNHPNWFLLDSNGNRIIDPDYLQNRPFYMDIGHPQAQNRVVERLRSLTRDRYFVPQWIFFDNWSDWPRGVQTTRQYRDWAALLPAWTSLLNRVAPVIRQELGAKLMVNVGSRIAIFLDGNVGEQWIPQVDGIVQEGAWVIYNSRERRYVYRAYNAARTPVHFTDSSWISTLRAVNAYPQKTWALIAQCDVNDREMFRFIVASYLVTAHSNCLLALDDRVSGGSHTFRAFHLRHELFIPLGEATGTYRVEQGNFNTGALFARDFQYGIVLVNPHPELQFQYRTTRAYKDWDGNVIPANTVLTIPPRRGVVLYAAPEINMTITPSRDTALPGEVITFTVQYRNDGLADATNVRISVPLPEGMEFVSSSTGGQHHNRQIVWTLPQIRAGQSGTLTFQARVQ